MKQILILFFAFNFILGYHLQAQDPTSIIENYLSEMGEKGFSGTVLVAKDGKILHKAGYGFSDREGKVNNTTQTVFTTGSITKPFTGTAILKLEMLDLISVNDLMSKYISDVPKDKKDITIHHLLTHSAGFPGSIGRDDDLVSTEQFIKDALSSPLKFTPGSKYRYSNVGYSILAIILEKQSGMTYESFLKKYIFQPAGMESTGYVLSEGIEKKQATGYDRRGDRWGKLTEKNWGPEGPGWHLKGNGGILSTVEDMHRFDLALRGNKILSEEAKKKLYARHIEEGEGAGTYYGYGWAIFPTPRNTDLITHNGGNGIFFADFLRYIDENITIVFMTNAASRKYESIPWEIARILLKPGYVPDTQESESEISEDEEEAIEFLARKFLAVINSPDQNEWKSFFKNYTTKDFQEMADIKFHMEQFGKMHNALSGTQPQDASIADGTLIINMTNGLNLELGIENDDSGNVLISGISLN